MLHERPVIPEQVFLVYYIFLIPVSERGRILLYELTTLDFSQDYEYRFRSLMIIKLGKRRITMF